jgi:nucleotide-binding universal stress UspA family protein
MSCAGVPITGVPGSFGVYWQAVPTKEKQGVLTLNRILLVSDFSASAEAALRIAGAMARQSQASLLVLHVIETGVRALPHWRDIFRSTEVLAGQEAASRAALDQCLTHPVLDGLAVDGVVQYGNPIDRITDMAPRADLVIMGTGETDAVSGVIAREVAHSSATPVLLVPPDGGTADLPAAGAAQMRFNQILLAIDLSRYAPQAIEMATVFAADNKAPLLALQILDPQKAGAYPVDPGMGLHHNLVGLKALLEKRLAEVMPGESEASPPMRRVLHGSAAEVILEQMAEQQTELVVMSAHAYGTLRRFFTESTIDTVLAQASCPLLAVPLPRSAGG